MEELLKELEELKQKIAEIDKKIEEKQAETSRWKPQKGDTYWFINDTGRIYNSKWYNNIDKERYLVGNYYQTKEECEFTKEKLKVIAELKEFKEPKKRAWDREDYHYFFYYDCTTKRVGITHNVNCMCGNIYFESEEKARQALDTVSEERIKKYYLEVEE